MQYQLANLGNEAKSYIYKRLQDGLTFAKALIQHHDVEQGAVVTLLPQKADSSPLIDLRFEQFVYGGLVQTGSSLEYIADFIEQFLGTGSDKACIFENYNAEPTPSWLDDFRSKAFVYQKDVYNAVFGLQSNKESIKTAILESRSGWIFIGALTTISDASNWLTKADFSIEDIVMLSINTEHIIVDAFDGEGYLIWSKHEITP